MSLPAGDPEVLEDKRAIYKARKWIKEHPAEIRGKLFEQVAEAYPGDYRAFMCAWTDMFGGI